MSTSPVYFNGLSNYASDLNNAISRQVQIASLPIQILDNDVTTLTSQSSELSTLNSNFPSVQSAISSISSAAGNMLSASVSNSSVASATLGSGATEGSYTLAVTSLGSFSNSLSNAGSTTVTDPTSQNVSASGSYTLTVNGATIPITLATNNLNALAQSINNIVGVEVQATVVNVGSNSAPDYRLSLQSDHLGPVSMQLNDGQDLMTDSGSPGTLAQYTIDGQAVSSDSDTVTLAPGLTVNLTGQTTDTPTTITVASNASGIANALQSFVSSYNSAITELGKNRGQGGGALTGDSTITRLTDSLRSLANYTSGGSITSMAALGLSFSDNTGQLSFDQTAFDTATTGQTDALTAFLGSATGGGFLQMATNVLTGIEDPTTGTLSNEIASVQSNITSTNSQITDQETRITQLQASLTTQMAAADALIYSLQQRASLIQGIITAQQDAQMAGN